MAREIDFVDECYADKDLSLLKKLTLVIPTYNRNYYLSRSLWYHAHFPFGQIIVADSSPEEKKVVNRETVAKVREMFGADILYLEYEPETEKYGGDIYRKWGDAVMHVETEYSQICTDKEFLIPITLTRCIEFLDNNYEYVFSDGNHHNIEHSDNIYYYNTLPSVSSSAELSIERFFEMVNNPGCSLLSLFRTTHINCIYSSLLDSKIYDIRFGELYIELLSTMLGKSHLVNESIHTYRDTIVFSNGNQKQKKIESSTYRYPKIWDYPDDYYNLCYNTFKQGVIKQLTKTFSSPTLNNEIDIYLNTYITKRLGKPHPLKRISFLRMIYDLFPKKIQLCLLKTIFQNHNGTMDYSIKTIPKDNESQLIIKIINEFNVISDLSSIVHDKTQDS